MATYDPTKNYTWAPDTKFVLNGRDFGLILNTFRAILSTPEANNIISAYQANIQLGNILSDAVAEGKIIEITPPEPPTMEVVQPEQVNGGPKTVKELKKVK